MDFNFYDQYRYLSNVELLKIVRNPTGYQAAAVEAATTLLAEREIPQTDVDQADAYLQEQEDKADSTAKLINTYKEKAVDLFEPLSSPDGKVDPGKWLNLLLLVIGLVYLWTFYSNLSRVISTLRCRTCSFNYIDILQLAFLVYVPVAFYLLLKRKRWGWILLFGDNLMTIVLGLWSFIAFFAFRQGILVSPFSPLLPLVVRVGFAYFLLRKDISGLFGITDKDKRNTIGVAIILPLLFIAILGG